VGGDLSEEELALLEREVGGKTPLTLGEQRAIGEFRYQVSILTP